MMTEWVPVGQTVNQTYYLSVLVTLRELVCKKWPELWKNNSWILHQDKAPAHNALSVKLYLADKCTPVFEHAPYSPDLAQCDFFLFPKIKSALKGTRFESMEAVKQKTAELLKTLTKEDFQHCFDQWKKRMGRYVGCDAINVPVDVDTMVQQLPHQLDDDQSFNVNIKKTMIHESTYQSSVVIKSVVKAWLQFLLVQSLCEHYKITVHLVSFHANIITSCGANAIGDDPIKHLQCNRSAQELEVLLVRQNLAISETWMEDSMPVNVPGFDLRSSYNTTKHRQIVQLNHHQIAKTVELPYIPTSIPSLIVIELTLTVRKLTWE
ncbi:putative mariner transposase [Trichonephila clavipes]|nr:putative mariner transposase [Trichonephila clavipes]